MNDCVKDAISIMNSLQEELGEVDNSELDEDDLVITEEDLKFEQAMIELFNELNNEAELSEDFVTFDKLGEHFGKHCLASSSDKKSSRTDVYYDFTKLTDYAKRERFVSSCIGSEDAILIDSLLASEDVLEGFKELLHGNKTFIVAPTCGLRDSNGKLISIIIHSFANDSTTNYSGNTVDYMIRQRNKTKTLYAIDADYLKTKLNSVIHRTFTDMYFEFE